MKHILPSFAFLLFILGCTQFEAEYTINCQFPRGSDGRQLLVTDYKGEIIGRFDISWDATSLSQRLTVSDENAKEFYDLHLIDTGYCISYVYSHLAVPNGASVFLNTSGTGTSVSVRPVVMQIHGIESFDSLQWIGWNKPSVLNHKIDEKRVDIIFYREQNQSLYLRLRANGVPEFRYYYFPGNSFKDTVNLVNWQDFAPESAPLEIEMSDNTPLTYLEVNGVSTDFKHFVPLRFENSGPGNGQPILPQFHRPESLAEPPAYHVKIWQGGNEYEDIFLPGEPLRFETPDMHIDDIILNDRNLSVKTSGEVDLLNFHVFKINPTSPQGQFCGLLWEIKGSVETFENVELPTLSGYLPPWLNESGLFEGGSVTAYQFDKYDYLQVREGFPFKLKEPFAVARSGYRSIWRSE